MKRVVIISSVLIFVGGCAIEKDKNYLLRSAFKKTKEKPTKLIEKVRYVALPGQLKPYSKDKFSSKINNVIKKKDPLKLVDNSRKKSTFGPRRGTFFNSIQVYPYMKGALYKLIASTYKVTDIRLKPGEKVVKLLGGDTLRWKISQSVSGAGKDATNHVLIKPIDKNLTTNLVIHTDQRSYYLELESVEKSYMSSLSWTYENDDLNSYKTSIAAENRKNKNVIDRNIDLNKVNFNYSIHVKKGDPKWKPKRVFDDGEKVYIKFSSNFKNQDAPLLFIKKFGQKSSLVNYAASGNYYVVDRLFNLAELRIGHGRDQEIVKITKKSR